MIKIQTTIVNLNLKFSNNVFTDFKIFIFYFVVYTVLITDIVVIKFL